MKISKELKEKFFTNYNDKTEFSEKARLLQSIWRNEKKLDYDKVKKYGNYLTEVDGKQKGKNFLTTKIFNLVKEEVKEKQKNNKVIQEPRIWTNLLSSQPMAFNLFGELKYKFELTKNVFSELYPERKIKEITGLEFEYSPERKSKKYTNDSSAFDVFIKYLNANNEKCFFGIEVKYAESLDDEPASHKDDYVEVANLTKIFMADKIEKLKQKPIQQIWRDHLLALSMFFKNDNYKIGDFIYLFPEENINCANGIKKYEETLVENLEHYFKPLTIEKIVTVIKKYCQDDWILDFENRYIRFEKITNASL